jgi:hypothetical protein
MDREKNHNRHSGLEEKTRKPRHNEKRGYRPKYVTCAVRHKTPRNKA